MNLEAQIQRDFGDVDDLEGEKRDRDKQLSKGASRNAG